MVKNALYAQLILCQILLKLLVNALMLDKNTMMSQTPVITNVLRLIKSGEPTNAFVSLNIIGGTQIAEYALQTLTLTQLKQLVSVTIQIKFMTPTEMYVKTVNLMLYLMLEELDVCAKMVMPSIKTINVFKSLLFV